MYTAAEPLIDESLRRYAIDADGITATCRQLDTTSRHYAITPPLFDSYATLLTLPAQDTQH